MSDQDTSEIRAARQELDEVIDEIRAVPGFERFLAPPTFHDIAVVATEAPIVYLAAADPGGVALVVSGQDVRSVDLPELSADALRTEVERHLAAYTAYREAPDRRRDAWSASLDEICAWLWTTTMGPVLGALAGAPAATLVAGGLLGLLPLHAAWTPDASQPTGRRHALDDLTLNYAPNARALAAARAIATDTPASRLLAVIDPRPVTGSPLPWAVVEGAAATAAFGGESTSLVGGAATRRNVLRAIADADVLHLACHGYADLVTPLDSGLRLAGNHDVTLRDLMTMPLRVRLAVLSACETSLPGTALPDEVVALPTGLLQAGVAGVIASLWAVPDRSTAMLMTDFHRRWRDAPARPPQDVLREAQRWLRDTTNDEKREAWIALQTGGPQWLPPSVTKDFIRALDYRDPDARDQAAIRAWGAFTHIGA
jgi:CHAT domain-containing protein